jgi:amylosucrase
VSTSAIPSLAVALAALDAPARVAFDAGVADAGDDLRDAVTSVYGVTAAPAVVDELLALAARTIAVRKPSLRALDASRAGDPQWFQHRRLVGYVAYADRFAGDLRGVATHLDYLTELGVGYLHLMPLLQSRAGENDGGYAVADYRAVDARLGTMDDLAALADQLRERGVSLCVDLVLNHTAKEHEWAQRALAGERQFQDYYFVFPDRAMPDEYERTLREVFPEWAPGNFTWMPEIDAWVWTTFNSYQWDLDYSNPAVLVAMTDALLNLANQGVEIFRLDAVPFMWKQLGTSCENLPQAHQLLRAMRAVARIAAPGVIFKAEAIVAPDDLVQYLGAGDPPRRECDIAYNNQLMVMVWSSIATRDAGLMATALARMNPKPDTTSWVTYLRCHDDIGWAVSDVDAAAMGWSGPGHRRFLSEFYAGTFAGSFARGELFQVNPATNDSRISGSAASLIGIEAALAGGDEVALAAAVDRLVTAYSIVYSIGGVPLLYMGDELGLRNDRDFAAEPAHANDNRWLHRPAMDWSAAARRSDPSTLEGRLFAEFRALADARHRLPALDDAVPTYIIDPTELTIDGSVFCYRRGGFGFLALANFADDPRRVDLTAVGPRPFTLDRHSHGVTLHASVITMPARSFAWLLD